MHVQKEGVGQGEARVWRLLLPCIKLKRIPATALKMVSTLLDIQFLCIALHFRH